MREDLTGCLYFACMQSVTIISKHIQVSVCIMPVETGRKKGFARKISDQAETCIILLRNL